MVNGVLVRFWVPRGSLFSATAGLLSVTVFPEKKGSEIQLESD